MPALGRYRKCPRKHDRRVRYPVLGDVLKLTLANRSSDRDIEHEVRELMNQVEQLQSANAGLQETNRIQATTLLDLRQKYSDAAQNADLQEKQQQLLELSSDLMVNAKNIARSARTWWNEVWGKGTKVLEAIMELQGYYNNPHSAIFASSMGGQCSNAQQDLQREHIEHLVRVARGTSRLGSCFP